LKVMLRLMCGMMCKLHVIERMDLHSVWTSTQGGPSFSVDRHSGCHPLLHDCVFMFTPGRKGILVGRTVSVGGT